MPFALPPLVLGLIGLKLGIGIVPLMLRLAVFIGGAALPAAVLRRLMGGAWLRRHTLELSGLNVLILLLFAVAIMDGVNALLLAQPQQALLYAGTALAASLVLRAATFLAFVSLPRIAALTTGIGGTATWRLSGAISAAPRRRS